MKGIARRAIKHSTPRAVNPSRSAIPLLVSNLSTYSSAIGVDSNVKTANWPKNSWENSVGLDLNH
jgi:hypothetical protein